MGEWIRRHKGISGCLLVVLILLGIVVVAFSYIWSKLGAIQYDDGSASQQITEEPEEIISEETLLSTEEVDALEEKTEEPLLPDSPVWKDSDVLNVLLIGTDDHGESFSDNARSDSMILASVNKSTGQIKLISLERAIGVPVLEGQYEGQYDWLTHIFRYGGADLLLKTVQTCFSVDVERYVRINFATLIHAIDALGGVDLELTQAEADFLNDPDATYMWSGREPRSVTVGMNHLDGVSTLTYARIRAIDSDWKRVERQRKVIISVIEKLKASGFAELDTLADEVLPLVQTNFTQLELAGLLLYAPNFINASVEQMTIPQKGTYGVMRGMGGRSLYAVDFEANAAILQDFLY